MTKLLEGKTGLILGVANKRSLAWGCARSLAANRVIVTLAPKLMVNGLRPSANHSSKPNSSEQVATADGAVGSGGPAAASAAAASLASLRQVSAFCLGDDIVVSGAGPARNHTLRAPPISSRL